MYRYIKFFKPMSQWRIQCICNIFLWKQLCLHTTNTIIFTQFGSSQLLCCAFNFTGSTGNACVVIKQQHASRALPVVYFAVFGRKNTIPKYYPWYQIAVFSFYYLMYLPYIHVDFSSLLIKQVFLENQICIVVENAYTLPKIE